MRRVLLFQVKLIFPKKGRNNQQKFNRFQYLIALFKQNNKFDNFEEQLPASCHITGLIPGGQKYNNSEKRSSCNRKPQTNGNTNN